MVNEKTVNHQNSWKQSFYRQSRQSKQSKQRKSLCSIHRGSTRDSICQIYGRESEGSVDAQLRFLSEVKFLPLFMNEEFV